MHHDFFFRDLHPLLAIGTATDRYAGWVGQIYTPGRYAGHITRRIHEVDGRAFVEDLERFFRRNRAGGNAPLIAQKLAERYSSSTVS